MKFFKVDKTQFHVVYVWAMVSVSVFKVNSSTTQINVHRMLYSFGAHIIYMYIYIYSLLIITLILWNAYNSIEDGLLTIYSIFFPSLLFTLFTPLRLQLEYSPILWNNIQVRAQGRWIEQKRSFRQWHDLSILPFVTMAKSIDD